MRHALQLALGAWVVGPAAFLQAWGEVGSQVPRVVSHPLHGPLSFGSGPWDALNLQSSVAFRHRERLATTHTATGEVP